MSIEAVWVLFILACILQVLMYLDRKKESRSSAKNPRATRPPKSQIKKYNNFPPESL